MYLDDAVNATARFVGRTQWMYLDKNNGVAVGVGQPLATADDAARYHFFRPNAEIAEREEIREEFERVKQMTPGYGPGSYRRSGSLLLPDEEIDRALRLVMSSHVAGLALLFRDFHDFPNAAKVALLDLRFALGIPGIKLNMPTLFDKVTAQKWDAASLECHRGNVPEERNEWTKEQFVMAGNEARIAREQTA